MTNKFSLITQSEPLATVRDRTVVPDSQGLVTRGTRSALMLMGLDPSFKAQGNASLTRALDQLSDTRGYGYQEFLLEDIQVNLQEKVQINQNLGNGEVLFFFGQSPVYVNLSGTLIDDVDNQWFLSFMESYQNATRGSQLAKNKLMLKLVTASQTFIGVFLAINYNQSSSRKVDVPFQIQFLAKSLQFNSVGKNLEPSAKEALTKKTVQDLATLFGSSSTQYQLPTHTANMTAGLTEPPTPYPSSIPSTSGGALSTGSWYTQGTKAAGAVIDANKEVSPFLTETFSRINSFLSTIANNLTNLTGDLNSAVAKGLSPINSIIGEYRDVSLLAEGIVRQIVTSLQGVRNQFEAVKAFYDNTSETAKNAAGYITFAPATLRQSAAAMLSNGSLSASSISQGAGADILKSSTPYSASDGASV